jgi:hypothetical protein
MEEGGVMRVPIINTDWRPLEMQQAEMREMGIEPPLDSVLWRESTTEEDYLRFLEFQLRSV